MFDIYISDYILCTHLMLECEDDISKCLLNKSESSNNLVKTEDPNSTTGHPTDLPGEGTQKSLS